MPPERELGRLPFCSSKAHHHARSPFDTSACLAAAAAALCLGGSRALPDYVNHGFKVGPEYETAKAEIAPQWIDSNDSRVGSHAADLSRWWSAFNDPRSTT